MRIIGNDPSVPRQTQEVASGTLPNGKPVVVNTNGTVSVVGESSVSQAIGSTATYESASIGSKYSVVFDSSNNKIVISYRDGGNSNYGTAVVGTVSGTDITFGTPVVYKSSGAYENKATFDSSNNKVVVVYNSSNTGYAKVGTVSGTSISFGSEAQFDGSYTGEVDVGFDSNSNKVVVAFADYGNNEYGNAVVGTVSGTSISFGSGTTFESAVVRGVSITFDSSNNKIVIAYQDAGNSNKGTAVVGTVSGTSISFGTPVVFNDNNTYDHTGCAFDSANNKIVIAYRNNANSSLEAIVGTVSGTSISFGTAVVFEVNGYFTAVVYDSSANKIVIGYKDASNNSYFAVQTGTISGTSISFSNYTTNSQAANRIFGAFDSNANKPVIAFSDNSNDHGKAVVITTGYTSTNITSENYIGISSGTAFQTGSAASVGSATVYNAGAVEDTGAAFDSNSNKIVIAFKDGGDSNKGKAIVGTVSGSSISFGSEVTFNNGSTDGSQENISVVFDSTNNKVIIAYRDVAAGTPFPLKCIVGTVSGTSISFGSATTVKDCNPTGMSLAYDSNAGKVVVAFGDGTNSGYGTAAVGTVSGTSISFGSLVVFANSETYYASLAYDSNAQKIVAVYQNSTSSGHGTAIVGTVSGTSISFGSAVVYNSAETNVQAIAYDASAQKVVIGYRNNGNSSYGTAIVGTVSGTSISFGSAVVFESSAINDVVVVYDANAQKPVLLYQNEGTGSYEGTAILGTISGTSISFGSSTEFESDTTSHIASAYDSNAQKLVISYRDGGNSNYGTARVFQPDTRATTRGQVADGGHALVDTQGAISDNQIGLTAGQSYFVQTDGTLGTTAANPSVFAGTAVSATKLIVKG